MISVVGTAMWDVIIGVEELPARGQLRQGALLAENPGGAATNTAAWAAMAGSGVHLFTRVPATMRGTVFRSECARMQPPQADGLVVQPLQAKGDLPTCYVMCTPDGERSMLWVPSVPDAAVSGAHGPEFTAYREWVLAQSTTTWVAVDDLERRVSYHQRAQGLRGLPVWYLQDELAHGRTWELLVGSLDDAPLPDLEELRALGCRLAVMTDGAHGARVSWEAGDWVHAPAAPAQELVDTVGAGDAFLGGLLAALDTSALHTEQDALAAVAAGARAGARAVGQRGGWPAGR